MFCVVHCGLEFLQALGDSACEATAKPISNWQCVPAPDFNLGKVEIDESDVGDETGLPELPAGGTPSPQPPFSATTEGDK